MKLSDGNEDVLATTPPQHQPVEEEEKSFFLF
jgi:hypothetical protein